MRSNRKLRGQLKSKLSEVLTLLNHMRIGGRPAEESAENYGIHTDDDLLEVLFYLVDEAIKSPLLDNAEGWGGWGSE